MNKRISILFLCLCFGLLANAQDPQTKPDAVDTLIKKYKKVMIIPFEPQQYLCPANRKFTEGSNKTTQQLVQAYRIGIATELQNQFLYLYSTVSLIHINDTTKDLRKTYESIYYKFEEVPKEEEKEKKKKKTTSLFGNLTSKTKKKKSSKTNKKKVNNGQVTSSKSLVKKFANVKVKNPRIFPYLNNKYGSDLYVFITEMDIEDDISDQFALQNGTYERILRFHFSILDGKGKTLEKGVVEQRMSNKVVNVKSIKSQYFPLIAKKLKAKLPQPQKPKVNKKKAVNVREKIGG